MVLSASHYNDMGYIQTVNNVQTRLAANTKLVYDNVTFGFNANLCSERVLCLPCEVIRMLMCLWVDESPNRGLRFYIDPSVTSSGTKHTLRSRL